MAKVKKISDILDKFNPVEDKYISREFQSFGIYLAEQLDDTKYKSLYIKLAKDVPRSLLEKALSFVKIQGDDKVRNKGKLFMWKLKELRQSRNDQMQEQVRSRAGADRTDRDKSSK